MPRSKDHFIICKNEEIHPCNTETCQKIFLYSRIAFSICSQSETTTLCALMTEGNEMVIFVQVSWETTRLG